MTKFLELLWSTIVSEWAKTWPRLIKVWESYTWRMAGAFPLGWLRPARPPFFLWATQQTWTLFEDTLDIFQSLTQSIPALVVAHVVISKITIDPALRQRVMTLDQVALFPARIIIDQGIRKIADGAIPRELQIGEKGKKIEELWDAIRSTSPIRRTVKALAGSIYSRVIKLVLFAWQWGQLFGLLVCLFNYLKLLEDKSRWDLMFTGALSQS
jgi:hypothetical protein